MKKLQLSKRAKIITNCGLLFLIVNFALTIGLAMKHGASAFPPGNRDASGSYVIDHGKRVDFDPTQFKLNYYQGMIAWIAFPAFLCIVLLLYATGDVIEREGGRGKDAKT